MSSYAVIIAEIGQRRERQTATFVVPEATAIEVRGGHRLVLCPSTGTAWSAEVRTGDQYEPIKDFTGWVIWHDTPGQAFAALTAELAHMLSEGIEVEGPGC